MIEEWRDIIGYEGLYQVSNLGRVRTLNYRQKVGKIKVMSLLKMKQGKGHLQAVLSKKGCKEKRPLVHRLVFEAFYRKLLPNEVVHHLNQVKTCNLSTNLVAWDAARHESYHKVGNKNTLGKHIHSEQYKAMLSRKMKETLFWRKKLNEAKES